MQKFKYTVRDPLGLHARPAGILAKKAASFRSEVILQKDDKKVDCQRLLSIMSLCVKQGETVTFAIEGEDEEFTATELEKFCAENL